MAKNSVLSRPQVSAAPSRHDFDRSFVSNFNQSAGMILPVFCEQVIAGTKGKINVRRFTRSKNVIFPAFQQVTQHTDFYIVPLRMLWSFWNDWKENINDLNSTRLLEPDGSLRPQGFNYSFPIPVSVPCINLSLYNVLSHYNNNANTNSTAQKLRALNDLERLCDLLGYGDCLNGRIGQNDNYLQSLFKFAAYQKVYYDHYRNTSYESNNPYAYNLDWISRNNANGLLSFTNPSQPVHWNSFESLTELHYVNYRNDYFHNIYPSLNYSLSSPNGLDWSLPSDVVNVNGYPTGSYFSQLVQNIAGGDPSMNPSLQPSASPSSEAYNKTSLNPQGLRALFALDKLMRASAYAPKHVYSQIEARFGVKVNKKVVSDESEYLGAFMNDIVFGEVTSTANTAQAGDPSNLGEIGGKGVGASDFGKDIDFYAEEDSIIIGVQYFLPRAMYDAYGCAVWNTKLTKNDFFQPEFEHLGLRPLLQKEISLGTSFSNFNNIIGYKEPNQEYKVGIDKNHGLFKLGHVMFEEDSTPGTIVSVNANSQLSAFSVHTTEVLGGYYLAATKNYFKCRPSDLDFIFEENYDGTQLTDQFYGNLRFKFVVNAPMSVHGNPML